MESGGANNQGAGAGHGDDASRGAAARGRAPATQGGLVGRAAAQGTGFNGRDMQGQGQRNGYRGDYYQGRNYGPVSRHGVFSRPWSRPYNRQWRNEAYGDRGHDRGQPQHQVPLRMPGADVQVPPTQVSVPAPVTNAMPPQRAQENTGGPANVEQPVVPEAGKAAAVENTSGGKKEKTKEKPKFCFRCFKPGHKKEECTVVLFCGICLSTEHLTAKCTVYKNPRQTAYPVGFEVDGFGFYHIPHAPLAQAKNDNKTALVRVEGGVLSIPQLVQELVRFIPEKWTWQVNQVDENSFVADMQRSVAFGKADIKDHGVSLHFEEWKEEDEGDELDTVWVRVFRLPEKLREFPVFWAIGSMLGATQAVDMTSTIDNSYGRVQVAVMNVNRIPRKLDVVIGKRFYVVRLQVEGRDPEPIGENMNIDDGDNDRQGNDGKDGNQNKGGEGEQEGREDPNAKQKKGDSSKRNNHVQQEGTKQANNTGMIEEVEDTEDEFNIMRATKYPKTNVAGFGEPDTMQSMNWAPEIFGGLRAACGPFPELLLLILLNWMPRLMAPWALMGRICWLSCKVAHRPTGQEEKVPGRR
ncbi:hypothetical protein EJB05_27876, partial [Eragrostis curvula]